MHGRTTVLEALPQPRHAASAAADVVTSHRGLGGAVLSIEGTRTYASTISMGALAVFVRFSTPKPGGRLLWCRLSDPSFAHFPVQNEHTVHIFELLLRVACFRGAWLTGIVSVALAD